MNLYLMGFKRSNIQGHHTTQNQKKKKKNLIKKQTFLQSRHTDGQQAHEKMLNITNLQANANQSHYEISPHNLSESLL